MNIILKADSIYKTYIKESGDIHVLKNINLSEPRKFGDKGVQIVFVNYGDNNSLYIQTPKANVVWDSKYFADNAEG